MIPGIVAGSGGSVVLWTPAAITTQLWFDADDAGTITLAMGVVSQWDDKSGNGRHVSQATATNRPAYNSVQLNSKPVLTYDNANDGLLGSTSLAGLLQNVGAASLFVVRRYTDFSGSGFPVQLAISSNSGATARAALYMSQIDDLERVGGQRLDADTFTNQNFGDASATGWSISSGQFDWTNGQIAAYRNGTQQLAPTGFQTAGNTSNTTPAVVTIGCWVDGTLNMAGDIAEVIATHSIDATERQVVEGYLAWKWGLQASLPGGHPYASGPPTL